MTLQEALDMADEMQDNTMSTEMKIRFISEIEGKIHGEILMKHEHTEAEEECPTYDDETDTDDTELLVPAPYDMIYVYWLTSRYDYQNKEWDKFNNDRALFENAWEEFSDFWTREHMPLQQAGYYTF